MTRFIGTGAVIAIVGIISIFTVGKNDVGKYNDKMVDMIVAMDSSFIDIGEQIGNYYEGETVDDSSMRTALSTAQSNISTIQSQAQAVSVPDDDHCRSMHQACTAYIDHSKTIADTYTEVLDYIATHNPATETDTVYVAAILDPLMERDDTLFNAMAQSQEALADEYNLTLE